ncbi:patatin-like phospholipase family protein [Mesorhizobium sp. M0833]|uniref:patatin-like phospholipase family protein n=1 Tax=Mesorhizobium sp. M0833 TaxID=2957009 RepID=UPI003337C7A7
MVEPSTSTATSDANQPERVALALSGGGARAMAFHLGCLRALHSSGVLGRIEVISSVSGGSVLAALYCHHKGDFSDFEKTVRQVLARGFSRPAIFKMFATLEGVKAALHFVPIALIQFCRLLIRVLLSLLPIPARVRLYLSKWLRSPLFRRKASRTTILRRVLSEDVFNKETLADLRTDRPKLIIVACELQTKSAFYFARDSVGSWRLGRGQPHGIEIAHAVAASAAFPVLLPALDEYLMLEKNGVSSSQRVILTDGGVYDNLGLAPLWPDRDPAISLHAGKFDTIIACRAGYGLDLSPPSMLWPSRMIAVLGSIHGRAQNLAMNRLFDLKKGGTLKGFIIPYLGQSDDKLAFPPVDLVTAKMAASYPTDFSAMPVEWIDRLSKRGEQLTLALLQEHLPRLLKV